MAKKHKPKRKKLKVFLIIILILALTEVLALLWLWFTVGHYRNFWQKKAREPGEITYLALGDSAAQGLGATSPMRGYVGLIAKRLEQKTGKHVRIVNLSVSGATVRQALKIQIPHINDVKPDLITIEIGANDVKQSKPEQFQQDFVELLAKLPKGTYVANMPLFNSRPSSTQPAKNQSAFVEEQLKKRPDLVFVDLQKQTIEHQSFFGFAPDLFHPNNFSYKNWSDAFWLQIDKK